MTPEQEQDLLVEWSLYSPEQKEAIMAEFRQKVPGDQPQAALLDFLKEKLQLEGYWKKIGLT